MWQTWWNRCSSSGSCSFSSFVTFPWVSITRSPPPPPLPHLPRSTDNEPLQKAPFALDIPYGEQETNYSYSSGLEMHEKGKEVGNKLNRGWKKEIERKPRRPATKLSRPQPNSVRYVECAVFAINRPRPFVQRVFFPPLGRFSLFSFSRSEWQDAEKEEEAIRG